MIYYLATYLFKTSSAFSFMRLFTYITVRSGFALITALLILLIFGKSFIRKLLELKMGQPIRGEDFNLHQNKVGTPTMGGIMILIALYISVFLWGDITNKYLIIIMFGTFMFGLIGFIDDYLKLKYKSSDGLSARKKLLAQIITGLIIGIILYKTGIVSAKLWDTTDQITKSNYLNFQTKGFTTKLTFPFFKNLFFELGWLYPFFVMFVIVGASNAVNLTDGLDGLASGTVSLTLVTYTVIVYITGNWIISKYLQVLFINGIGELTIFSAALLGSILGFLWYNSHPAEVFMGDVGSLSIGGAVGILSVLTKNEILLILAGGIFVAEALSVILQIGSFKLRGKRIFKMAPIHHHFEKLGWHESKVIIRFWIIGIMLTLLSLSTFKLR